MILAGALEISISLLLVAHVVVSLLLILIVLMQRPKQEGLGAAFGGGAADSLWGAQTTNVLQKGTAYFGTAFLALSLILAILIGKKSNEKAVDTKNADVEVTAEAVPGSSEEGGTPQPEPTPTLPPKPAGDSLKDKLEGTDPGSGETPPASEGGTDPDQSSTPDDSPGSEESSGSETGTESEDETESQPTPDPAPEPESGEN